MKNKRTKFTAISRYNKVKSFVTSTILSADKDLNSYIQQLIQAESIKSQLVTQIIKSK